MRIVGEIKPAPYDKSVMPALTFEFDIEHLQSEAILHVKGFLKSDDGAIFTGLHEVPKDRPTTVGEVRAGAYGLEDKPVKYSTKMVAFLDKVALDNIENRRLTHPKRDVWFFLHLQIIHALSRARLAHLKYVEPSPRTRETVPEVGGRKLVFYQYGEYPRDYSPTHENEWVISGQGGPVFLKVEEEPIEEKVRIPAQDWIHDFAPKLGLGKYFVVEVPKGDIIKEAWDYVEKAEECYRNWDSKGACANCREAGSLLDRMIEEKFGKDSLTYQEKWGRSYSLFKHLASLDLHVEDISRKFAPEERIKIGRGDIETLLIITKALVKYAGSLLT